VNRIFAVKHMSFRVQALATFLVATLLSAPLTISVAQETPPSGSQPASQPAPASQVPSTPVVALRLAVGDELDVTLFNAPEMNAHERIDDTGEIQLALIGNLHIAGLTTEEAEALIEKRLRDGGYVRDPHVNLFVKEYRTSGIAIMGEVQHPGVYPSAGPRHLWDLMLAAGGATERAGSRVVIRHRDSPETTVVSISTNPEQAVESNVEVFPGDTIVVTRGGVVYVLGEVAQSAGYPMGEGDKLTVLQAIAKAHGPTRDAALNRARLIRKTDGISTEIPVKLGDMLQAKVQDIPLQSEDILFIPGSRGKYAVHTTLNAIMGIAAGAAIAAF